jgi:hypothetical protein
VACTSGLPVWMGRQSVGSTVLLKLGNFGKFTLLFSLSWCYINENHNNRIIHILGNCSLITLSNTLILDFI